MDRTKKVLLGPMGLDCNRGDQALLWEAIDLVRRVVPNGELAVMSEDWSSPEDPQTRQTRKLDIRILPMLVSTPRRTGPKDASIFFDSGWPYFKMKLRAG
jgi:hypothetical protein